VQLAVSVNNSLASLDTLHTAAGSLDNKLQQTLEQQVRIHKTVVFCTCLRAHGVNGHIPSVTSEL
jgi:hypothetical protein